MQIIKPPKLKKGDTLGIVSPSLPVMPGYEHLYNKGKNFLLEMGFKLKEGETLKQNGFWSAGDAKFQAEDINRMFADPEVKGIIAQSGGYTAIGVLEHIDFDLIKSNPKPFIGMSDITTFHLAFLEKSGLLGFHMDETTFGIGMNWNFADIETRDKVSKLFFKTLISTDPIGELPTLTEWKTLKLGEAQGRLIGGILRLFDYQVGTQYFPSLDKFDGAILFWEETHQKPQDLRRSLFHLKHAGILDRISGMIVGKITKTDKFHIPELKVPSSDEIILEVCAGYSFPILADVDFGHYTVNLPMILGLETKLDATNKKIEILESAVK